MAIQLDPRKAHSARVHGDVLCILTYVNDERAIVLMPAHRRQGAPWWILCESAAYKYDDPVYLARAAKKAAEVMGLDETTSTWYRIAEIIMNNLMDLIRMPSAPEPEQADHTIGEMKLMANGELLAGREIRPDIEAPTYG